MASSALCRGGGAGAALGGALLAVWGYLQGNMGGYAGPVIAAAMGLLIDTLLLAGLAGLCAWWWEGRTDLLGAVGFVLVFAGVALSVAHGIHAIVTASGIAKWAPWWVYVRAANGLPAYVASWLPVLPVGMVAVGIGSVRSGALGGWGILPLAMGLLGAAYQLTDLGGLFGIGFAHVPFGAAYSLGWVLLGCLLWTQGTARTPTPRGGRASSRFPFDGPRKPRSGEVRKQSSGRSSENIPDAKFREPPQGEARGTSTHLGE